MLKHEKEVGF